VALNLQTDLTGLEINDVAAGDGHRATSAQSSSNHMCVRVQPSALRAANSSAGSGASAGPGGQSDGVVTVSVIPAERDCRSAEDNPAGRHVNLTLGDTHKGTGDAHVYARGDTRTPADRGGRDGSILLSLGAQSSFLATLAAGAYQLCVKARGYPSSIPSMPHVRGSGFLPTGIGLQVQARVQGLSANYLASGDSLQVLN